MPKRSLQNQLIFSYLILLGLLSFLLAGAVFDFFRLSRKIDQILKDNYKSVIAAQNMKETLERQDSAATFFLAGQDEKARKQYQANWPLFFAAYQVEAHNITELGEQKIADDLGRQFKAYRQSMERLLYANPSMGPLEGRSYYFSNLEPAFQRLKRRAQDVLDLNEAAIIRQDRAARIQARRSMWTALGITSAAIAFAALFIKRMASFVLAPLRKLAHHAEEVGAGHLDQTVAVEHEDEVGILAETFNKMTVSLREAHRREEERFHRAERMSAVALRNLYDPVIVTDAHGIVVHWNRAAEGLFGPIDHAKGKPVHQVIADKRICEALDRAIHHEHISAAEDEAGLVAFTAGDAERTYRLRATPMMDEESGLIGAVAVLEDITHLREVDRLKTEFIGVASHELKTPVTSLLMSVQLLQEGAGGDLTPEQGEIVKAQKEDLQRLDRMMRDLLDITRLEAGVVPPRPVVTPVAPLIENAVYSIKPVTEAKGLRIEIEIPDRLPDIRADKEQITRALVNLLSNACRHSPEKGVVRIRATLNGEFLLISVSDAGTGIPEEYLGKVFDRAGRVPAATQ